MTKCSILNTEYKYGGLIGAWVKFHQSKGSQASGLNHVEDFTPFGWHLGTQKTCSLSFSRATFTKQNLTYQVICKFAFCL